MNHYCLSVSGIVLQVDSDQPLSVEEPCLPFLREPTVPHVRAVFRCEERLPSLPEKELHRDIVTRIFLSEQGTLLRFFYAGPDSTLPYACARWDSQGSTIRIAYLSRERSRFSSLMNCFFYLGLEQILIRHHRLWPHAACVETHLGGILFSGPSGIGKSTQADLWCRFRNARQLNGDRPILSKEAGIWLAWGAPYAGSSRCYVNDCCPVSTIILLRQAKECSLERLNAVQAFREIWKGLPLYTWDRDFMERSSSLTMGLIEQIPVYRFACTPDEQAVACLEQALGKDASL